MTSAERRARERAELTRRIIDVARDLFAKEGYEAVTLRRIADAIEYAPATVYSYFADKDSLIRTLCAHDFAVLSAAFDQSRAVADPLERIARLGEAYIQFAVTHPNHYRLMFMTPRPVQPEGAASTHRGDPAHDGYAALLLAVDEALNRGDLRPELGDAQLIAQTLWAAVHGVAALEIALAGDTSIDWRPLTARVRAMLGAMAHGLCAPQAPPPEGAT